MTPPSDPFPGPVPERHSLALLSRIQEGEREAWNELYRVYHDRLLLTVRLRLGRRLRHHLQSEDVFQSVAMDALSALQRFEYRGPGSLERFLEKLVVNKIRDRADTFNAQKRAGTRPLSEPMLEALPAADRSSGSSGYLEAETYERLEHALEALPEELREVLILRKVDGLSSKEVAEQTGRSDAAVRKAYSRALARLTTIMRDT